MHRSLSFQPFSVILLKNSLYLLPLFSRHSLLLQFSWCPPAISSRASSPVSSLSLSAGSSKALAIVEFPSLILQRCPLCPLLPTHRSFRGSPRPRKHGCCLGVALGSASSRSTARLLAAVISPHLFVEDTSAGQGSEPSVLCFCPRFLITSGLFSQYFRVNWPKAIFFLLLFSLFSEVLIPVQLPSTLVAAGERAPFLSL